MSATAQQPVPRSTAAQPLDERVDADEPFVASNTARQVDNADGDDSAACRRMRNLARQFRQAHWKGHCD